MILLLEGDSWLAADGASGIGRGGGGKVRQEHIWGYSVNISGARRVELKRELVWFSEIFPSILVPSQTEN